MPSPTVVIANPLCLDRLRGSQRREFDTKLRAVLGDVEIEQTRRLRDAERIAREAVRSGVERLVVAGGDGTANEVVTGLLTAGLAGAAQVGFLPLGSGRDLARKLGLVRDLDAAIAALASGGKRRLDIGRVDHRAADGQSVRGHFVNVASVGLSVVVDGFVERAPRVLGGGAAYLMGTLSGLLSFQCVDVRIRVDDMEVHEGPVVLVAVANGEFFGGGMRIAPGAELDDGVFEVVIVGPLSKPALIANLPGLYRGSHLRNPAVSVHRGRRIEIEPLGAEVGLELDGDVRGVSPAVIEMLPGAITVFGAGSGSEAGEGG